MHLALQSAQCRSSLRLTPYACFAFRYISTRSHIIGERFKLRAAGMVNLPRNGRDE
nr:MAG TPA: hypothetical protein [Bacteriophage sp.]